MEKKDDCGSLEVGEEDEWKRRTLREGGRRRRREIGRRRRSRRRNRKSQSKGKLG